MYKRSIMAAALATGIFFAASEASAQFRTVPSLTGAPTINSYYSGPSAPYTPLVNSWWYNPYYYADPYGGYLRGVADVIDSQGQYLINTQQAYLLKEQVRSAKLENRRRALDYWLYRRNNLPSLNEQREKSQQEEVRRSLSNPPLTEVWSGKSLNDILANIRLLQNKGYAGPDVPISPELLKQINVGSGAGNAHAGLLKDAGNLQWPVSLQTLKPVPENETIRKQIDTLMVAAKGQAGRGRVDAGTITELQRSVNRLQRDLVSHVGDYSFQQYSSAKRFLRDLNNTIALLERPDATKYINGQFTPKGQNVKELVAYMSKNGLQFSPALSGQEAAYSALQNALVEYDLGASARISTSPDPRGRVFPYRINPNPKVYPPSPGAKE